MAETNAARRFTDTDTPTSTVIGKGIHVKGEFSGSAPIEIWGSIEGKARTEGLFWVREGGKVKGEVVATNVIVEGEVDGTITAREKAELRASCKVKGDLTAKTVAVAEGSFFEGSVHMGNDAQGSSASFKEKRKR